TIKWEDNLAWTASIIEYLTDNVSFRLKLFSDSTKDAKASGRSKKTGKDGKQQMCAKLAEHVFAKNFDSAIAERYAVNPQRFTKSLGDHLARLKKDYRSYCTTLGKTGAGLKPDEVTPGSEIANKIEAIWEEFPFWDDLHAFWCEIPSFNPIGISN
ncbi:hypothetical protein M422DRAFT_146070, partial [Sphaerobolus stellatus SS14]